MMKGCLFIGLMSGTSMDGVDGVLVRLTAPEDHARPEILSTAALDMPASLRDELLALNESGPNELHRAALASQGLTTLYAQTVYQLLDQAALAPTDICAIGAHGQTVRHRPELGFTLQLNAPALLAELTGIDVVADFRSRDIAAGGQGAPLVPPFHAAMFASPKHRAILNLGGIANLTLLHTQHAVRGFDTGPANVLMDLWCQRHTGQPYDKDGQWAATGVVHKTLLQHLVNQEPWLALPPPKSTGRDLFNMKWLEDRLQPYSADAHLRHADIQATLQYFTARTVADALETNAPETEEILVCGGGARNTGLMRDLATCLKRPIITTDIAGVPGQWIEAIAFAWLAQAFVTRRPASAPEVTGARGSRVLGALYPA